MKKIFVRFETPAWGFLYQHDCSEHPCIPALGGLQYLILTKDEYSRLFVEAQQFEKESSFAHLAGMQVIVRFIGNQKLLVINDGQ